MSEGIDFELPVYRAEVYHNTPDTDGVWNRVFNLPEDACTSEDQIKKVMELFEADGLPLARIYGSIYIEQLHTLEGGDDA